MRWLLSIVSLVCLSSCGIDAKDSSSVARPFSIEAEWQSDLKAGVATNEVILSFKNQSGALARDVEVKAFHPRMPAMNNHGTDEENQRFIVVEGVSHAVKVQGIYFNMGGEAGGWVVTVEAIVDGVRGSVKIEVPEVK